MKSVKNILSLKQESTPDNLYAKYIGIVAGLPEDTNLWLLTLCSTLFSILLTHLKDEMEETDFVIPALNNQSTNPLQISGLRMVQTAAVASYWLTQTEEKRLRCLFPQFCHHHGGVNYVSSDVDATTETPPSTPQHPGGQCHYTNKSQAETTLQQYSSGGVVGANKLSMREGTDGKLYPYNPNFPEYLSRFPVGFGGCFKCVNLHTIGVTNARRVVIIIPILWRPSEKN